MEVSTRELPVARITPATQRFGLEGVDPTR
jgi:hypothetical protein